ncbi:MAG: SDR family oxidoreductase [Planctomycetota bacterium]|nr:MAG: SDR family oxidoreductase [Planctomycetota bacterium]
MNSCDLLIFGCGYLGRCVADRYLARGAAVSVVTRSEVKARELAGLGIAPVVADLLQPPTLRLLPRARSILYCVGYDRESSCTKRDLYVQGLRNVLSATRGLADGFVYISSTSVYGQDDGSWVDEASPTEPITEGGEICRDAEHLFADPALAPKTWTILRLAGLYGPGRLIARVEGLKASSPVGGNPEAWLNLIHRDDAVTICERTLDGLVPSATFLVCDDRPITRQEYYRTLALRIGAPEPIFSESVPTRQGTTGWNKRCSSQRIKQQYQVEWRYPTIDVGLPSALE